MDTIKRMIYIWIKLSDDVLDLKTMLWCSPPATNEPPVQVVNSVNLAPNPGLGTGLDAPTPTTGTALMEPYKMTSDPRGYCLILENETFKDPTKKRKGTERDSERLVRDFHWLGFIVILCKDKTKRQMKQVLKFFAGRLPDLPNDLKQWSGTGFSDLGQLHVAHGDGFVCCILSHGDRKGVEGVDGKMLKYSWMKYKFSNNNCPALLGKPKMFIVQACRGHGINVQGGVVYKYTDGSLPEITDFLFAYATIDLHSAFRNDEGSWFIQTLCEKLEYGCPSGADMNTILTGVNNALCDKETTFDFKQSSVFENNLRKLLILRPLRT